MSYAQFYLRGKSVFGWILGASEEAQEPLSMSTDLTNLLSHPGSVPFIFYHHPHHVSFAALPELPKRCHVISLDTIEHHTPRIIYSSGIKQLDRTSASDITTWDGFARALREAWATRTGGSSHLSNGVGESSTKKSSKGKGKASGGLVNGDSGSAGTVDEEQIVILIGHAERLRSVFGGNWPVVTRLAELVSVIFKSFSETFLIDV